MLGYNDSSGCVLSWDRTTPGVSFCPGIERHPCESLSPRIERLHGSHSVPGYNDSRGVFQSRDITTPGESFSPGIERFQGTHSVLG